LIDLVVERVNPDHSEINADVVRVLQTKKPPYDWPSRLGRRFLFYWQVWRWIMEGRLTAANADSFYQQLSFKSDGKNQR